MPSVIFVCTANICRSPMAAALFKSILADQADRWSVASAGTWARIGDPIAQRSQFVLAERGLDARSHRSQPVSARLLESFNLILTMEQGQKEALRVEFPQIAGRVYMLSEMIGLIYDIQDPIIQSLDDYRVTLNEINRILTEGLKTITRLAGA